MEEQDQSLPLLQEAIQHLADVEQRFAEIGLKPELLNQLRGLIEERDQALAAVQKERDRQFWSDASTLAAQIRAGNKIAEISAFLRRFAEHVAAELGHPESIVDGLCEMTEAREKIMRQDFAAYDVYEKAVDGGCGVHTVIAINGRIKVQKG